ncbi:hypothetical protein AB0I81_07240 [Nonomuraea sp. NPDC050404]|uniref:hypothetical protein n=1 Tax=Nonomuraea sp. NPDC050404 TaxID=3155783 RepID=UPI0033D46852
MQKQIIAALDSGNRTQAQWSAELLRDALRTEHGIQADTHVGYGLALVSVWVGLLVWCDGDWYWWRANWDERRKRVVYACHTAMEPSHAAQRVAFRYTELRNQPENGAA